MNHAQSYCRSIKRMCNSGGQILPLGYQKVEYIENLGRGRIVTSVPLTSTYYVEVQFSLTDTNSGDLFGYVGVSYPEYPIGTLSKNRKILILKSNYVALLPTMQLYALYDLVFYYDSAGNTYRAFLDGTELSYKSDSGCTPNNGFTLFYSMWNGIGTGRIYKVKIKDSYDGNTTLDMIPCYRKSDSEPGFYDLVSQTFFSNVWDTTYPKLAAGPEV